MDDPSSGTPAKAVTVRAVVGVFTALSLLVCGIRFYARKFVLRTFGLDDYLAIVALVLTLLWSALSIAVTYYGVGYHQNTIPQDTAYTMMQIVYVSNCGYLLVGAAVKSSVTVFLTRVFPQRYIQNMGKGIIVFLVLFTISGGLVMVFQCKPVQAAYDKTIPDFQCFSPETIFAITMYQGALMFAVDVVMIVLPMHAIWRLNMPVKKRMMTLGVFSLGILGVIAALVRLPTLVYTQDTDDYSYSAADSLIWMTIEFHVGLLVGSLPTIPRLFRSSSSPHRTGYISSNSRATGDGFEMSSSEARSKKHGIMVHNDIMTTVDETKNDSQERIFGITPWERR